MYQRKIAQWGLDKKHKAPEMRAILRLARQREAAGQESIFRIRGRRTDIEEVYRYFKRKGEDPAKLDVRESPIPSTITVETPSPPLPPRPLQTESTGEDDAYEISLSVTPNRAVIPYPTPEAEHVSVSSAAPSSDSSNRSESVTSTPRFYSEGALAWQVIPNYPQLGPPIDPTFEFQCSRFLLHRTQMFFDAVVDPRFFSQENAKTVVSKPWRRTLSSWSRATSEGHELMQRGQIDETLFKLRDQAHASVEKHIKNRSPIILLRYFEIIYGLCSTGDKRDELFLDATLKYVLQMAQTVLCRGHPIRDLTQLLQHPQVKPIVGPLAQQGVRKTLQILFDRCGPCHPRILYVLDSRTQTLLDEHQYDEAARQANLYLERAKLILGDHSYETCQALRMRGDAFFAQDRLDQAVAAYTEAFYLQRHLPSLQDRGIIGVRTQRGLAGIARVRGHFKEANDHLQIALQMAIDAFGENDVQVKLVREDLKALCEDVRQVRGELAYRPLDA